MKKKGKQISPTQEMELFEYAEVYGLSIFSDWNDERRHYRQMVLGRW